MYKAIGIVTNVVLAPIHESQVTATITVNGFDLSISSRDQSIPQLHQGQIVYCEYEVNQLKFVNCQTVMPLPTLLPNENDVIFSRQGDIFAENYKDLCLLTSRITVPCLRAFIDTLCQKTNLFKAFVSIQASCSNHHAYQHGLLQHSIEVSHLSLDTLKSCHLSDETEQLIIIAALFHDIGKTAHAVYTDQCTYMPNNHEVAAFSLMNEAVAQLYSQNRLWHDTLLACWEPPYMGISTECVIAKAVKNADQMSAAKNVAAREFRNCPAHWYFRKCDNRRFLRTPI
ncbi:HD domain-containing protein [uncultured Vibrio sp.]|uniref:HD domain-containing protein n=1 Tax=uncultured Vibrio sp. TaxID=114054 RepID=UPI0025D8D2C5|nr:HD domain-containing protein [uncultured Vibrio sp.]